MLSVIVKIGRDPPLNGSSCCASLFSSVPFLTDQVVFFKSNHPTSTCLEYELIIAQGVCFRAQPSFPVSTGGLTIVTQHDNLLYAKKCSYGNIQMTNKKLLLIYSPLGSIYVIIKMRDLPRYDPAIASQDIVGARVMS